MRTVHENVPQVLMNLILNNELLNTRTLDDDDLHACLEGGRSEAYQNLGGCVLSSFCRRLNEFGASSGCL